MHNRGFALMVSIGRETRRGNREFLEWMYEHQAIHLISDLEASIAVAVSVNNVAIAQWLLDKYPGPKWSHPNSKECSTRELTTIKWLEENYKRPSWNSTYGCAKRIKPSKLIAATIGQLDIIQYLYRHPLCEPELLTNAAAQYGRMEIAQWLHEQNPDCSVTAVAYAVKGGHFNMDRWLQMMIRQ